MKQVIIFALCLICIGFIRRVLDYISAGAVPDFELGQSILMYFGEYTLCAKLAEIFDK